jgi:hypothetical protein
VQVAVAQVAEAHDAQARVGGIEGSAGRVEEAGDRADRHRDVVLDADAFALLGFGDVLAQLPEGLGLAVAGGNGAVDDAPFGDGGGEFGLEQPGQGVAGNGVAEPSSTYQGLGWPRGRGCRECAERRARGTGG